MSPLTSSESRLVGLDARDLADESVTPVHAHQQAAQNIAVWKATAAYSSITQYVDALNRSVRNVSNDDYTDLQHCTLKPIHAVTHLLDTISTYMQQYDQQAKDVQRQPELDHSGTATTVRYGNPVFRQLLKTIESRAQDELVLPMLTECGFEVMDDAHTHDHSNCMHVEESKSEHPEHATHKTRSVSSSQIAELTTYLCNSFGNIQRIDYGTGHELHFLCFLYGLHCIGLVDDTVESHRWLVLHVYRRYLSIIRTMVKVYWLEPAGSRGVWGLDDYTFLVFLFGSSQLVGHRYIKPRSVRQSDVLSGYSQHYLYLEAIDFIMNVKTSSFAEHSPMLYDITGIKQWEQVNQGLQKMYDGEVLSKWTIIQHFIYSSFLLATVIGEVEQVTETTHQREMPCCTDSVQIPSAIAAKRETQKLRSLGET